MKPVLVIYVILSAWEVGGSDSEYSSCKPLVGLRIWYWGSRFWGLGVRIWGIFGVLGVGYSVLQGSACRGQA